MTVFGITLDGGQIATLALLLASLVFWIFVLRGERDFARWARWTDEGRKARRDAGVDAPPPEVKTPKTGPWG